MITTSRPRIFLTPADLPALKQRFAVGDPVLKEQRRLTDAFLTVTGGEAREKVPNRALMYLLTGEPRYAAAATTAMLEMASKGIDAISPDSYFYTRSIVPMVAIGYDWCYDALMLDERTKIEAALDLWMQAIWPDTNPARSKAWGVNNPSTNYWFGFLVATWLGSLARGDETMLALSLKKWNEVGLPYLQTQCAGGFIPDGTTYGMGSLMEIGWMLRAHKSATGEDLTPSWMNEARYACFHLTAPDMHHQAAVGDQADAPGAFVRWNDRAAVLCNPVTGGLSSDWAAATKLTNPRADCQWMESLWCKPGEYPFWLISTLYQSPGCGLVCARTAWAPDATAFWCRLGERGSGHAEAACGLFQVNRGGDILLGGAHIWSQSGTQQAADLNNSLTVDGRGQDPEFKPSGPPSVTEAETHTYIRSADLAHAYDYTLAGIRKQLLTSYAREFVFLKDGTLILRDTFKKTNPASVVKLHLNTKNGLTPTSDNYWQAAIGQSQIMMMDGASVVAESLPQPLGDKGATSSWKTSFTGDEFLLVFQFGPTGFTPLPVTRTDAGVKVGDLEVRFTPDGVVVIDDHISPRDEALDNLESAVHHWFIRDGEDREAEVPTVVAAAKALIAVTG